MVLMLFKIQQSIVTNEHEQQALIYNQDKSILFQIPAKHLKPLIGNELRVFVEADVEVIQNLILNFNLVKDQNWVW